MGARPPAFDQVLGLIGCGLGLGPRVPGDDARLGRFPLVRRFRGLRGGKVGMLAAHPRAVTLLTVVICRLRQAPGLRPRIRQVTP